MTVFSTGTVFLVLSAFLASAVEMVEALTIVLAVGVSREWRSTLIGVAVALVTLTALVAAFGPALAHIPIGALRVVVGSLLLIFGLQWLRKAILRAAGFVPLHDEEAIYARQLAAVRSAGSPTRAGMDSPTWWPRWVREAAREADWYAFTIAFKGVLLEGLEVAFIVLTFGANAAADGSGSVELAALGAGAAGVLVALAGGLVHRPLSRVPENALKFVVGAMLTTFGIFWGSEGVGVGWPGEDAAILAILAFVVVAGVVSVRLLQPRPTARVEGSQP